MNKVFIGILTCNRPTLLAKSILSICSTIITNPSELSFEIFILDNWADQSNINLQTFLKDIIPHTIETCPLVSYYHPDKRLSIAEAKNILFINSKILSSDFIFILEDDVAINPHCFETYINIHRTTGLPHLMCGTLFTRNKPIDKHINHKKTNNYVVWFEHCVGGFCFYTKQCIEQVGLMDEKYVNDFEHVDHSNRILRHFGYSDGKRYWYPDIKNSEKYVVDLDPTGKNSMLNQIRDLREEKNARQRFITKFGV